VQEDVRHHRRGEGVGGFPKASRLETASHLFGIRDIDHITGVGV